MPPAAEPAGADTRSRADGRTTGALHSSVRNPVGWLLAGIGIAGDVLASPVVLVSDLFHPERTLTKRWLFSFLLLLAAVNSAAFTFVFAYRTRAETAWGIVRRQTEISGNIGEVPFSEEILLYAAEHDLDPALVASVVEAESSFRPEAVSPAGARGLMQIRPATWREMNPAATCTGDHPPPSCGRDCVYDPAVNIRAGCRYLRQLLDLFGGNLVAALAAYNSGASAVLALEPVDLPVPPFPETERYVRQVVARWSEIRARAENAAPVQTPSRPGGMSFAPAGVAVAMWVLLAVWFAVKGRRVRDWEALL